MATLKCAHDASKRTVCSAAGVLYESSICTVTKDLTSEPLRLDTFLKLCGIADTGGYAKRLIQDGHVEVNGEVETRRRRKLAVGDVVRFEDEEFSPDEYLPLIEE